MKIDKKMMKFIAIVTIIFMIIAHGYAYFNIMFSHDSLRIFHWGDNLTLDSIDVGRYLIPIFLLVRGKYYPPFLIGLFSTFFMILINYYLVKIFDIRDNKKILLIIGILVSSCTLTLLNATYINYSDMYLLSMFLSVYSAFLIKEYKNGYLYCILPLFLSIGIYQSYLSVFVGIVIILEILNLLDNKDYKTTLKNLFKAFFSVVVSLTIYFIILKIVVAISGIHISSKYNSISNAGKFDGISNFLWLFVKTYLKFAYYMYLPSTQYKILIGLINVFLTFFVIYIIIKNIIEKKLKGTNLLMLLFLCIMLPFFLNFVCFISYGVCHQLMIFSFYLLYIFVFKLINNTMFKSVKVEKIYMFLLCLIIFSSIIFSNNAYLKKQLEFYSTMSVVNRITNKIENLNNYEINKTPVIIIGDLNDGPLSTNRVGMDHKSTGLEKSYSVTYYDTYINYYRYFLNYPINIIPKDELYLYTKGKNKTIDDMPSFPHENSILNVDGVIVVKLSDIKVKDFLK